MKRKSLLIAASAAALALLPLQGAWAQSRGGGGGHGGGRSAMHGGGSQGGWSGGSHGGGGWSGGSHGGGWHGGSHAGDWHGGSWRGGYWRGGYWGPSFGLYLGAPWYPGTAWGYPYYGGSTIVYDDPAPAYWGPATTTVIPAPAMTPARAPAQFRYYCADGGYYPDVRTCPKGWVQMPQR
ncbi:MAG: hypothetical protein ABI881_06790 [Betaproteobacteria bacterium]